MYLSYKEYAEYGGTLDEPTFNRLEYKCRKLIDRVTAHRVSKMKEVPECVKQCMYELITQETLYEKDISSSVERAVTTENPETKMVASFTNDGYQETYAVGSGNTGEYLRTMRSNLDHLEKQTVQDLLSYETDDKGVPLLYRGVF